MSDPEHIHIRNRKVISHHHKHPGKNKNRTTFWMLLGIIFLTAIVFIIPQFHPEKLIDSKGIWWFDAFQHIFFFFFFTLVLFRLLPFQKLNLSFFLFLILKSMMSLSKYKYLTVNSELTVRLFSLANFQSFISNQFLQFPFDIYRQAVSLLNFLRYTHLFLN